MKAYTVVTLPRCVVKILDYYYKKVPLEHKAFYLWVAAVPKKPWFFNVPVGVNISSIIAEQAGSTKYPNHSLRSTPTSRMFVKNVPENEIASHRSIIVL